MNCFFLNYYYIHTHIKIYRYNLLGSFRVVHMYMCIRLTTWNWITYWVRPKSSSPNPPSKVYGIFSSRVLPSSSTEATEDNEKYSLYCLESLLDSPDQQPEKMFSSITQRVLGKSKGNHIFLCLLAMTHVCKYVCSC